MSWRGFDAAQSRYDNAESPDYYDDDYYDDDEWEECEECECEECECEGDTE